MAETTSTTLTPNLPQNTSLAVRTIMEEVVDMAEATTRCSGLRKDGPGHTHDLLDMRTWCEATASSQEPKY